MKVTQKTKKAVVVQAVNQEMRDQHLEVAQVQVVRVAVALEVTMIQNPIPLVEAGPTVTSQARKRRKKVRKESSMLSTAMKIKSQSQQTSLISQMHSRIYCSIWMVLRRCAQD